jgi:hypothetical protein
MSRDVEASMTGRPQPFGSFDADSGAGRVSPQAAGYMELDGAQKDGDCDLVAAPGGVSGEMGCCNLFEPQSGAQQFSCGTCEHFSGGASDENQEAGNGEPDGQAAQPAA